MQALDSVQYPDIKTIHYSADYPPGYDSCLSKIWRVVWLFLSIVIFPIGLFRLAAMVTYQIMMGKVTSITSEDPERLAHYTNDMFKQYHGQRLKLKSPDGTLLDAGYFPSQTGSKKAIIFLPGIDCEWQRSYFVSQLQTLDINVLALNRRGVGLSEKGTSFKGSVEDAWSAFEYLVNVEKFDPGEIMIMGHSWGGAVATEAAALAQDLYPEKEIKLVNWSSFTNFATAAHALLSAKGTCFPLPFLISTFMRISGHNIDVSGALAKVKKKAVIWHRDDDKVPHSSQIISHLEGKKDFFSFELEKGWHSPSFSEDEFQAFKGLFSNMMGGGLPYSYAFYHKYITKM